MNAFANEPALDFSRPENRDAMGEALAAAHRAAPRRCPLLIDGEWIETDADFPSINPSDTEETIAMASTADENHVALAVEAAQRAQPAWAALGAEGRADILCRAADHLRRHRVEIAAWMTLEAGKPWREADADVCEAIDYLEYHSRQMIELEAPLRLQREIPGEHNDYGYDPIGLAAVISPWNFPLAIPTGMTSAALAAGNCAVLKPAEQTPLTGTLLSEALVHAGIPRGILACLHGPGETVGAALVRRPEIGLIAFTGSRQVGLEILKSTAEIHPGQRGIKRTILEMGGKNAIIVDSTADLDAAIPNILTSAFAYAGQKCSACSRLIVLEEILEPLTRRLRNATAALVVGPAEDPATQVSPLIEHDAAVRVRVAIERGCREGQAIHVGDVGDLAARGFFVPPAIITGLAPTHPLAQEEIFGPLLVVLPVKTFDEALDVANGTSYALTGGLESRTPEHIERARREFHVGNLYINRAITGAVVGRQPFGGFRFSGVGSKAGGPDYLRQFLLARTWSENVTRHGFAPLGEEVQ